MKGNINKVIKIRDARKIEKQRIKDIGNSGFFMYEDILCRRVCLCDEISYIENGIPFMEVPCGKVHIMDENTLVSPICDEQISVVIKDLRYEINDYPL